MPQYELNIRDYWQIIQKRRWVFMSVFFLIFILSVIRANTQKPVYRATAAVQWIERKTLGGLLTELVVERTGDPLLTQARIITSLPILEKVAVELGLVDKQASPTEIMQQALALQGMVFTNTISETNIIKIMLNHPNPEMAAKIVNKIAEVYILENRKEKSKESRNIREFIEKQLEEVGAKLKTAEEALLEFREKEAPTGVAVALQSRLGDLEMKRREMLKRYTPKYPDLISIEEEIVRLKKESQGLPQKELAYSRMLRDTEVNVSLYRELQNRLASARIAEAEKIEDVSLVENAMPAYFPISPNKRLIYFVGIIIGLVLGMAATSIVEQLDTSIGTIEDVETYLKLPALGVIPYLRTKDEKKQNFIQRLLNQKEFKGKEKILRLKNQLLIHYSSSSPISESYRILRTNIQTELFKEKIQGKMLLLTSASPEEGKSITIANLAIVMAQGNLRTLLIDADMRRSSIHHIFAMKDKEPGLCEVLRGTVKFEDAIRTFTDILLGDLGFDEALKMPHLDNLNILTAGSLPMIPAELLSSQEMKNLLESVRDKFDIILIDSPPVLAVADATILAPKTDGVILVYRVGKTSRSILGRAKTQLIEAGTQVKGIVLNNISPEVEMRYGYYYHYKYYGKYYGEKKEET